MGRAGLALESERDPRCHRPVRTAQTRAPQPRDPGSRAICSCFDVLQEDTCLAYSALKSGPKQGPGRRSMFCKASREDLQAVRGDLEGSGRPGKAEPCSHL